MTRAGEKGPGPGPLVRAVVALGSNLGDRPRHLAAGVAALEGLGTLLDVSHVYETAPVGPVSQPAFLNAVVSMCTDRAPLVLLQGLLAAESARDRVRETPGGPRTLDLDLLFYGDRIIRRPGLIVPHPRWNTRAFVCIPLLEILPELIDPESGWTVREWCGSGGIALGGVQRHSPPETLR